MYLSYESYVCIANNTNNNKKTEVLEEENIAFINCFSVRDHQLQT